MRISRTGAKAVMNREEKSIKKSLLLVFLLCGIFSHKIAIAASPWQWDRVLKHNDASDSMVMPSSLFIDEKKELYYVVDSGKNRLISFDRTGKLVNSFNAGKALEIPFDMVKSGQNGIWVIEKGRNSLSFINFKEKKVTPNSLFYDGNKIYPERVEIWENQLYVLNKLKGDIISYSESLTPITRYECPSCPWGFVDFKIHKDRIWALDQANKTVQCFNFKGKIEKSFELGDTVVFPVSLDIGPAGYIYIVDRIKRNVAVYDKSGVYKYRFLEKGVARGQLKFPIEIRFDPWGGLCLVDEGNGKVEILKR